MRIIFTYSCVLFLSILQVPGQTSTEIVTYSGLRYQVLKPGKGETAKAGQGVAVYESMGYRNGPPIYKLERPAPPVAFTLGENQAIAGVDEGVTGMQVGEIRKLIVPPALSQRTQYPNYLSKDSTLIYIIELVEIIE